MVLVVRRDIKAMKKGKACAQCCHAAVGAFQIASRNTPDLVKRWKRRGQAKVTLSIQSEDAMLALQEACTNNGVVNYLVCDAGRTQIDPGTRTVLGIGPASRSTIDALTGDLKLY